MPSGFVDLVVCPDYNYKRILNQALASILFTRKSDCDLRICETDKRETSAIVGIGIEGGRGGTPCNRDSGLRCNWRLHCPFGRKRFGSGS